VNLAIDKWQMIMVKDCIPPEMDSSKQSVFPTQDDLNDMGGLKEQAHMYWVTYGRSIQAQWFLCEG
jgi:hypothetical protein